MPTVPPPSRDAALEAHVFWLRFKNEIAAVLVIVLLAIIGFGVYRFYSVRQDAAASALLGKGKNVQDYQQVITRYPDTPAGAVAYLLLADAQRNEKKLAEANATLQVFVAKNPKHEFVSSAQMAIAANLESMGKIDEALSMYRQIAASYPKSFNAPLALFSQVHLLKAKNRIDDARLVCETILMQYRDSFWTGEAMRELRSLKPSVSSVPAPGTTTAPSANQPAAPPLLARPPSPPPAAPTAKPR